MKQTCMQLRSVIINMYPLGYLGCFSMVIRSRPWQYRFYDIKHIVSIISSWHYRNHEHTEDETKQHCAYKKSLFSVIHGIRPSNLDSRYSFWRGVHFNTPQKMVVLLLRDNLTLKSVLILSYLLRPFFRRYWWHCF